MKGKNKNKQQQQQQQQQENLENNPKVKIPQRDDYFVASPANLLLRIFYSVRI